jgi:hypothetical protein
LHWPALAIQTAAAIYDQWFVSLSALRYPQGNSHYFVAGYLDNYRRLFGTGD